MTVALLGPKNTYCDWALRELRGFGACKKIYCRSIGGVFKAVLNGKADRGFVPIENSEAGKVRETEIYIKSGKFKIIKTLSYPISHCVAVKEKVADGKIRKIFSHEQAFKQCRKFLKENFPDARLINLASTAAAMGLAKKDKYTFAVGSPKTAKIYGLAILHENIQDSKNNRTVFALVKKGVL